MKKVYYIILLASLFLTACENREIDWEVKSVDQMLVVEGSFTDELKKHQLSLSLSEDYFINRHTSKVSKAQVSITDGTNTYLYKETAIPGLYETIDSIAGIVGKTYTLNIDLDKPLSGSSHFYCSSLMRPTIKIDSLVSFIYKNPTEEGDSMILFFEIYGLENSPKGDYYTTDIYINNKLLNDTIDERSIYYDEASGFDGKEINYVVSFTNEVKPMDTIRFSFISVDRAYYDFVTGVVNIAKYNDPMGFSGPPANAVGNIKGGKAIGFFNISSVSTGISLAIDRR